MSAKIMRVGLAAGLALQALQCGSDDLRALAIDERSSERIAGRYTVDGRSIEFTSTSAEPFAGNVVIEVGPLEYVVRYDYAARSIVSDGAGAALDRTTQRSLRDGIELITEYLGADNPELPLHEQMLYAGLSMLSESAGMTLERLEFDLEPIDLASDEIEKSLGNDGVRCIKRNSSYLASYDHGSTVVIDRVITANAAECNGRCGPTCTQLTPWSMWTLDCLEHDACCDATSDDSCWTPLGECGEEYFDAEADFLRGFDPFRKHCGG